MISMLMLLLGGGVHDLASLISPAEYWKAKHVTVSFEQLSRELEPVKAADVSKFINDLDADDPKTRDAASEKIAKVGPAALPALAEAMKNGSPEVVSRATVLTAQIRSASRGASVRRIMAIRMLAQMNTKKSETLAILKPLLDSKDMFIADEARAAIAKVAGKEAPEAEITAAQRAADVGMLPAQIDLAAQLIPRGTGSFSVTQMMAQFPIPENEKAKQAEQAVNQVIVVLETIGNVRLDSVTLGFNAAPPGQPGNSVIIGRVLFDSAAASDALRKLVHNVKNVDGMDAFMLDDTSALMLASDHRVALVTCEPNGDLHLKETVAALKKGAGDFAANPDLPKLVKAVDPKASLWVVAKMSPGLRQVAGPFAALDTATITAVQSRKKDGMVTDFKLEGEGGDAGQIKQAADQVRAMIQQTVAQGRQIEKQVPFAKPMVDFVDSIKIDTNGTKATATGQMQGNIILPMAFVGSATTLPANPPPAPGVAPQ